MGGAPGAGMGGAAGAGMGGAAGAGMGGAAGRTLGGFGGLVVAGTGGRSFGGSAGNDVGGRGGAESCDVGCTVDAQSFCEETDVTWVCEGNHDQDLFRANCVEVNSSARLRYCCSKSFLADCQ